MVSFSLLHAFKSVCDTPKVEASISKGPWDDPRKTAQAAPRDPDSVRSKKVSWTSRGSVQHAFPPLSWREKAFMPWTRSLPQ